MTTFLTTCGEVGDRRQARDLGARVWAVGWDRAGTAEQHRKETRQNTAVPRFWPGVWAHAYHLLDDLLLRRRRGPLKARDREAGALEEVASDRPAVEHRHLGALDRRDARGRGLEGLDAVGADGGTA